MTSRILRYALLFLFLLLAPALANEVRGVASEAHQGFKEILDLWRARNYEGFYARLEHPPGADWANRAQRIVHGSQVPACCWEMLQDFKITVLDPNSVVITARVGLEVKGGGTRFVPLDFTLHRSDGVWKMPMHVLLELSDPSFQRNPPKVDERPRN